MEALREEPELDPEVGQQTNAELHDVHDVTASSSDGKNHSGHLEATLHRMEMQLEALQGMPSKLDYVHEGLEYCMKDMPRQVNMVAVQTSRMQAQLAEIEKQLESEARREPAGKHHSVSSYHRAPAAHSSPPRKGRMSMFPKHGRTGNRISGRVSTRAPLSTQSSLATFCDMPPMMEPGAERGNRCSIDSKMSRTSTLDSLQCGESVHCGPFAGAANRCSNYEHGTVTRSDTGTSSNFCQSVPLSHMTKGHSHQRNTPGSQLRNSVDMSLSMSSQHLRQISSDDDGQTGQLQQDRAHEVLPGGLPGHPSSKYSFDPPPPPLEQENGDAVAVAVKDFKLQPETVQVPGATTESNGSVEDARALLQLDDTENETPSPSEITPRPLLKKGTTASKSFGVTLKLPQRPEAIFSLATATIALKRAPGINRNVLREKTWILRPNSTHRLVWDAFTTLCIVFTGTVVPLQLVYFGDESMSPVLIAMLYIVDAVWFIDILLNFCTGFYDNGFLVSDKWKIARAYAKRWLLPDLVASWPLLACMPVGSTLFAVFAALKLLRVLQIGDRLGHIRTEYQELRLMSINITIVMFLIIHINACLWRVFLRSDGVDDVGIKWIDLYVADQYWVLMTMTTIGYGDISPLGTVSRLYAMAVMFVASAMFGAIVSGFTHITSSIFNDTTEMRVEEVTRFMKRRQVHRDLQRRVQHNLRQHLRYQKLTTMDPELLTLLSPAMQRELSLALLSSTVLKFPLFKGAQRSFVAEMAQAHTWEQVFPGDCVAEEGHLITEIVFVMLGCLQASIGAEYDSGQLDLGAKSGGALPSRHIDGANQKHTANVRRHCLAGTESEEYEVNSGAWFGEACFFDANRIYTATIVAVTECELAALAADDYIRIVQRYPRLWERHQAIAAAIASGSLSLKDLAYKDGPKVSEKEEKKVGQPSFIQWPLSNKKHLTVCNTADMVKVVPSIGSGRMPELSAPIALGRAP